MEGYLVVPGEVVADPAEFLDLVTDVPNSAPTVAIPVTEAGIGQHDVLFELSGFGEAADVIPVHGTLAAAAGLGSDQRGVHMSRIVESVQSMTGRAWETLDAFMTALVRDVAERQGQQTSRVRFDGLTELPTRAPVSGRVTRDKWGLHAEATLTDGSASTRIGLTGTIITACPCTRAYSWYATVIDLADRVGIAMANEVAAGLVTFTHSQRATVTVMVDGGPGGICLSDCYQGILDNTQVVHALLKRPDEHFVVRRAHERPQFTEDVVREVAAGVAKRAYGRARDNTLVSVASVALESIHAHTVQSRVEATVAELHNYLASEQAR